MKFSVIVPAYNSEKYIEETLDCLLSQTEQDIEVIVVNDGSTDSTGDIIDRYAEKDSRVVPVHQANAGVSAARNNGIERARGEYMIFIDGDDLLSNDAFEKLYAALTATGADLAIFRVQSFGDGMVQYNPVVDALAQQSEIDCYDKCLLRNFLVSNKVYKTELIKNSDIRFPPMRYSEDGAFFMHFIHSVKPKITGVYDALFMYRRHAGSVTHRVNSMLVNEFSKSMDFVYSVAEKSFEDAPGQKEAYLQEILFKDHLALMNEFYRPLWKAEDEDVLALIGKRYEYITSRMTDATKARCAFEVRDIGNLYFSKDEILANPFISVRVKKMNDEFLTQLHNQSMPIFEIVGKDKPKGKITLKFSGKEKLDPRLFKTVSRLKRSPRFGRFPDFLIKMGAKYFLKLYDWRTK